MTRMIVYNHQGDAVRGKKCVHRNILCHVVKVIIEPSNLGSVWYSFKNLLVVKKIGRNLFIFINFHSKGKRR